MHYKRTKRDAICHMICSLKNGTSLDSHVMQEYNNGSANRRHKVDGVADNQPPFGCEIYGRPSLITSSLKQ